MKRADERTEWRSHLDGGVIGIDIEPQYGKGARMLTLRELCEWLNITERHGRKLVERDAIPYRKIGHLLRFPEAEIEEWTRPARRRPRAYVSGRQEGRAPIGRRSLAGSPLPKSLIE
jgi:excisionase family DNA binding protein